MWVRSLCKHYHNHLREEGQEFEHDGELYEHIEPVKKRKAAEEQPQQGETSSRAMKPAKPAVA